MTQTGTAPSFTNTSTGVITLAPSQSLMVSNGLLDLSAGVLANFTGFLTTTGTPTVRFTTATVQPRINFSAGTVLPDPFVVPAGDSLRITTGTFAPPSVVNNGRLVLEGNAILTTALTTGPGSVLRVRGTNATGSVNATITNGFTNTDTLELVAESAGYAVMLNVATGTLTNASTGVLRSVAGTGGGTRTLAAQLTNQGTVLVPYPLTLTKASAAHVNSGTITMSGTADLTVTQTGTAPSFTNTGTIATNGRILTVGGGSLNLLAGLVSGFSGRVVTTGTVTFDFLPAAVQPFLTLSTGTTMPTGITVALGDSLRLGGGSFTAPSLTLNGALVLGGGVTVATPITTSVGSATIVRGSNAFGSVIANLQSNFTNAGTLSLIALDAGYGVTLNLGANTLTNAAGATLDLAPGVGGSRTLTAGLVENLGTINASYTTALNAPVNQRAVMIVAAGQSLSISGLLQLFTGSITTVTGTLVKVGGCSLLGGTIGGGGIGSACP